MAKYKSPRLQASKALKFVGTEAVLGLFADAYIVTHTSDKSHSLFFFQSQLPPIAGTEGITQTGQVGPTTQKCVARIGMSEPTFDRLLKAMAENRGATISFPEQKETKES